MRRVQPRQPLADRQVIDLLNVWFSSFASLRVGRGKVIVKLLEVASVIAQRVLADVTLVTQVFEKLG